MREERLFERLRGRERNPNLRDASDPVRTTRSVLSHLQEILNTKRGGVPIAEDYGLPDLTDFLQVYPESLQEIERSIRDTIQKYEPRLKDVRVRYLPEEERQGEDQALLSLRFQISARLATEEERDSVFFETYIGSDGKIVIKS